MCECGCTMNDDHYLLPGPGTSFYVITLRGHCLNCDAGTSVVIEKMEPGTHGHGWFREEHNSEGEFPFEDWADGKKGRTIVTGMQRHEFVNKLKGELIGNAGVDDEGNIDDVAAEVILEEMYDAAQTKPKL